MPGSRHPSEQLSLGSADQRMLMTRLRSFAQVIPGVQSPSEVELASRRQFATHKAEAELRE